MRDKVNIMKVIKNLSLFNKILNLTKKIFIDVKNEEVKITSEIDLWSHRMIESLMRDIDILRGRIQKIEQELRIKK